MRRMSQEQEGHTRNTADKGSSTHYTPIPEAEMYLSKGESRVTSNPRLKRGVNERETGSHLCASWSDAT